MGAQRISHGRTDTGASCLVRAGGGRHLLPVERYYRQPGGGDHRGGNLRPVFTAAFAAVRKAVVNALLPVLPGADPVIAFKGRRKMLDGGIAQILRHRGDAARGIGEQDGGGRHAGLRLFLQEGFAVLLLKEPFRLPGAKAQLPGQLLQGQTAVLIKKIFLYDHGGLIPGSGRLRRFLADAFFIVAHQIDQKLAKQRLHLKNAARSAALKLLEDLHHQSAHSLRVLTEPEWCVFKGGKQLLLPGREGRDAFPLFFCFQINAVFAHGILKNGALCMLHMRSGDVKSAGRDLIGNAVYEGAPPSLRDIVDLVAPIPVRMAGNGALKPFIDKIQSMEAAVRNSEINISVLVVRPHTGISFPQKIRRRGQMIKAQSDDEGGQHGKKGRFGISAQGQIDHSVYERKSHYAQTGQDISPRQNMDRSPCAAQNDSAEGNAAFFL